MELVSDKDVKAGVVPGLGRAVSKAKGTEFGSLLHQLGADFTANPYSPPLRNILLEINPDVADQLPKRRAPKAARKKPATEPAEPPEAASSRGVRKKAAAGEKKKTGADNKASAASEKPPSAAGKKPAASKKKTSSSPGKTAAEKALPESAPTKKRSASEHLSKRKPR
jgi:hypothetical protein